MKLLRMLQWHMMENNMKYNTQNNQPGEIQNLL